MRAVVVCNHGSCLLQSSDGWEQWHESDRSEQAGEDHCQLVHAGFNHNYWDAAGAGSSPELHRSQSSPHLMFLEGEEKCTR